MFEEYLYFTSFSDHFMAHAEVMVASFTATISLAVYSDPFGIGGLPALPGLSIAFLLANAVILWRRRRAVA